MFCGPDLGPNCLQRFQETRKVTASKERANKDPFLKKTLMLMLNDSSRGLNIIIAMPTVHFLGQI